MKPCLTPMDVPSSSFKDLLYTLLLKVGVAASFAALLARWAVFRKVLFTEERDSDKKVKLMIFLTPPLAIGVMLRLGGHQFDFLVRIALLGEEHQIRRAHV